MTMSSMNSHHCLPSTEFQSSLWARIWSNCSSLLNHWQHDDVIDEFTPLIFVHGIQEQSPSRTMKQLLFVAEPLTAWRCHRWIRSTAFRPRNSRCSLSGCRAYSIYPTNIIIGDGRCHGWCHSVQTCPWTRLLKCRTLLMRMWLTISTTIAIICFHYHYVHKMLLLIAFLSFHTSPLSNWLTALACDFTRVTSFL